MRPLVYKKYTLKEPDSRFSAPRTFGVQNTNNKIKYRRFSNWFNYVSVDEHHKVHCDKTCYTLLFMGKRRQDVTLKVGEKYYDYKKGIKEYK